MIVRNKKDVERIGHFVQWGNGTSYRFLTHNDQMGYTLTETKVNAGSTSLLEYKNHLEACYCIQGVGTVKCTETSKSFEIEPGTIYALDKNDRHYLIAETDLVLICVFSPALNGREVHTLYSNESSAY